jgi:DNA-binding FadR family transcriptional regulator
MNLLLMVRDSSADNSSLVLARLRRLVATTEAGERLAAERDLAAEMRVGRRAVRRALEVLEAEGAIWRRQGKGTFVGAEPPRTAPLAQGLAERTNPLEVLQARACLEPPLARLAALRATPQEAARLAGLCARLERERDADALELWDGALHRAIARIADNALLSGLFELVEEVRRDEAWRALRERARSPATAAEYAAQHRAVVEAIARHDPPAAEAAMRAHLAALARNVAPFAGDGAFPELAHAG